MKKLIIPVALATVFITFSASAEVTMATCEADYNAMLSEAETNRENAVAQIEHAIARTADDEEAGRLQQALERSFETEETFRNIASVHYRDCVKHVKSQ